MLSDRSVQSAGCAVARAWATLSSAEALSRISTSNVSRGRTANRLSRQSRSHVPVLKLTMRMERVGAMIVVYRV